MKYIFSILLCAILQTGFSQIIKTVGYSYTNGTPSYTPAKAGSALALDTVTWRYYTWNGSTWISDGFRVQTISGCSAPAYTPTKFQSIVVINACNDAQGGPEIYKWSGSVWEKSGGQTYTAGTGIDITGGVISATVTGGPDSTFANIDGTYTGKRINGNVYRLSTVGFGTADTTGVVNIKNESAKPLLNFGSNSSYIFNSSADTRANSGLIQNFALSKSFNDSASTSGDNQVFYMGFNVGADGSVKDNTKSAFWIAMENSFNNPAQQRAYEFHNPQITYPGGIVRRMMSSYMSNDAGTLAGFTSFTSDNFIFSDYKTGAQRAFWAFGEKGTYQPYDKGLTFVDTAIIKFSVNNVGGLLQRNAANSADIQLIKANGSNEVVLGGANESRIVASQHLNVSGAALITGASGFLNVGSAAFPTAYIVTTNTSEIARLVRTGETYYNSFHIASGIFQMISSSGAQPFSMSLAAPSQSLYIVSSGRVGLGINAPQARLQIESALDQQEKMMRLKNTTGFNDIFRSNVSPFNNVAGNPGDLAVVSDGTNGSLYGKYSGTGGSGWAKFLNLVDPNSATTGQALAWNGSTWAAATPLGTPTSASAAFEITSTTKGFLPPRMTQAQRDAISSPATALTLYCTDCTATDASTGVMQTYNGTTWKNNW